MVTRRMRSLNREDLERQLWFIRASFAAMPLSESMEGWLPSRLRPAEGPVTAQRLIAAAKAVADRLSALAVHEGDSANWVGLSLVTEREWQLRAAGVDLYSGMPGIILFLGFAGAVTGEASYIDLARRDAITRAPAGTTRPI
jgi:lantibiotic modifying enzyme